MRVPALFLVAALTAYPLGAEDNRRAFIVGVDRYDYLAPEAQLKVAVADAQRMKTTLESLDPPFSVRLVTDGDIREVEAAFDSFLDEAKGAECALVYFAGHGVEFYGANFLLVKDTAIDDISPDVERMKRRLATQAVSLQGWVDSLDATRAQVKVVILDCCRDNPLKAEDSSGTRSVVGGARGLAQVTPPSGTLISYSADAGQRANDGLFTEVLARNLREPGLNILKIFAKTREEVREISTAWAAEDEALGLAHEFRRSRHEPAEYNKLDLAGTDFAFTRGVAVNVKTEDPATSAEMKNLRMRLAAAEKARAEAEKKSAKADSSTSNPSPSTPAATRPPTMARTEPIPPGAFPASGRMEGSRAGEVRTFGGIEMVWCPQGQFTMGTPKQTRSLKTYDDEEILPFDYSRRDLQLSADTKVFGRCAVGKKEIFVGEALDVEVFAFSQRSRSIHNIFKVSSEDNGYQCEPFKWVRTDEAEIDGIVYSIVQTPMTLYAQRPGPIKVGPFKVSLEVADPDSGFGLSSFFDRTVQMDASTEPISVNVLPLPSPIPSDFSNGVGKFSIKMKPLDQEIGVGKIFSVEVTISGTGNHRLLRRPIIEGNPSCLNVIDCYKWVDVGRAKNGALNGDAIFFYSIVANEEFSEIPSFRTSFFDLESNSYKTISTPSVPVKFSRDSDLVVDTFPSINMDNAGRSDLEVTKRINFPNGFWIAKTETTQEQWARLEYFDTNSQFPGQNRPVDSVSWVDINEWLKAFNREFRVDLNWVWDLPTEAQWEYACRAGTASAYSSNQLDNCVWYFDNSNGTSWPVALKEPNPWGLHDMHGNVREWCKDSVENSNDHRAYRGGSWRDYLEHCRSSERRGNVPTFRDSNLGFRLVLVPRV